MLTITATTESGTVYTFNQLATGKVSMVRHGKSGYDDRKRWIGPQYMTLLHTMPIIATGERIALPAFTTTRVTRITVTR